MLIINFNYRGYSKWITNLAEMDERLLTALRLIRNKTWLYGVSYVYNIIDIRGCNRYVVLETKITVFFYLSIHLLIYILYI